MPANIALSARPSRRPGLTRLLSSVCLPLILICGACSVLTIDVDVYKGPLSNEPDVQTEQLAAMAIGAKPLLVALRDSLQWGSCDTGDHPGYKPDFMSNFPSDNRLAQRANAILSLYHPRRSGELGRAVDRLTLAYGTYLDAYETLRPADGGEEEKKWWAALTPYFRSQDTLEIRGPESSTVNNKDQAVPPAPVSFEEAYRRYFQNDTSGFRGKDKVIAAHIALWNRLDDKARALALGDANPALLTDAPEGAGGSPVPWSSADQLYRALSDKALIGRHADLLFTESTPRAVKDDFISRVVKIASAFARARGAIEETFSAALTVLEQAGDSLEIQGEDRTAIKKAAATVVANLVSDDVVELVGFLEHEEKADRNPGPVVSLLDPANQEFTLQNMNPVDARSFRGNLARELVANPAVPAEVRRIHERITSGAFLRSSENIQRMRTGVSAPIKGVPPGASKGTVPPSVSIQREKTEKQPEEQKLTKDQEERIQTLSTYLSAAGRKAGVTRGPVVLIPDEVKRISELVRTLGGATLGLEDGRAEQGLTQAIQVYLDARAAAPGKPETYSTHQSRLIDELVLFAQKVLMFANNKQVLDADHCPQDKDKKGSYTTILQIVGNSILDQADEISHTMNSDGHKVERWNREARSLDRASHVTARAAVDSIIENLRAKAASASDAATAASMDRDAAKQAAEKLSTLKATAVTTALEDKPFKMDQFFDVVIDLLMKEWESVRSTDAPAAAKLRAVVGTLTQYKDALIATGKGVDHKTVDPVLLGFHVFLDDIVTKRESAQADAAKQAASFDQSVTLVVAAFIPPTGVSPPDSPETAVDQLMTRLAVQRDRQTTDTLKEPYNDAIARVRAMRPLLPAQIDSREIAGTPKDPRSVIDELITTLRYEYVLEVKRSGAQSDASKNIAVAVKAASDQRASMIGLRPASAFLRSANPATLFQSRSSQQWENMLGEHALRGTVPYYDPSTSWDDPKGSTRMRAEVDKQFWQNINRVRVAGAGNTNYVIAKDDVGNWYVKDYGADPTPIINGAKSLALFAAGPATAVAGGLGKPKLPTPAATKVPAEVGATNTSPTAASDQPQLLSPLDAQIAELQRQYDAQADLDFEALVSAKDHMLAAVFDQCMADKGLLVKKAKLEGIKSDCEKVLKDAFPNKLDDDKKSRGTVIGDAVRALSTARRSFRERITAIASTNATATDESLLTFDEMNKVLDIQKKTFSLQVGEIAKQRTRQIDQFRRTLDVIESATLPPRAKSIATTPASVVPE